MTPTLLLLALAAGLKPAAPPAPEVATDIEHFYSTNLGVALKVSARVLRPEAGHEYLMKYQVRLHTKKGDLGPCLGDAAWPKGKAYDLGPLTPLDYEERGGSGGPPGTPAAPKIPAVGFRDELDVTRKELSGMTNLPKNSARVVLRVEPHVYDLTAKRYVSAAKTNAIILVAFTGKPFPDPPPGPGPTSSGPPPLAPLRPVPPDRVEFVWPVGDWFSREFTSPERAAAALALVDDLDAWDSYYPLLAGFDRVFRSKDVKPGELAVAVRAVPKVYVHRKGGFEPLLEEFARSADPAVKAAAEAKLAEAKRR